MKQGGRENVTERGIVKGERLAEREREREQVKGRVRERESKECYKGGEIEKMHRSDCNKDNKRIELKIKMEQEREVESKGQKEETARTSEREKEGGWSNRKT